MTEIPGSAETPPGNIYILGFMGSGKTSAGRRLAERLGWPFLDLDEEIVLRSGMPVRDIFISYGEAHFRRLESEELKRAAAAVHTVIALGGGAFCSEENRKTVQSTGTSVWLDVPIETIIGRCEGDLSRPLFSGRCEMKDLFEYRRPAYALADIRVQAGGLSPEAVVERILAALERRSQ